MHNNYYHCYHHPSHYPSFTIYVGMKKYIYYLSFNSSSCNKYYIPHTLCALYILNNQQTWHKAMSFMAYHHGIVLTQQSSLRASHHLHFSADECTHHCIKCYISNLQWDGCAICIIIKSKLLLWQNSAIAS